ncbi:MAG: STAS domain-containing protein [Planctomycetota bacterium]|jgi:anti-anti-sigma factor
MEIHQRDGDGVTFLTINGSFETDSLPTFSELMERLVEGGGKNFCINFRGVTFINSTALGYLVDVGKRVKAGDGELVFSEPSKFFADTFRTLELHHLFELFPSDRDASDYFSDSAG